MPTFGQNSWSYFCSSIRCRNTLVLLKFPRSKQLYHYTITAHFWSKVKFICSTDCSFYMQSETRLLTKRHERRISIGLIHDDVLQISFTTTPRSHVVSTRFFHILCRYSFQFLSSGNTFAFWMSGVVVKLISKTSSCIRPIWTQGYCSDIAGTALKYNCVCLEDFVMRNRVITYNTTDTL